MQVLLVIVHSIKKLYKNLAVQSSHQYTCVYLKLNLKLDDTISQYITCYYLHVPILLLDNYYRCSVPGMALREKTIDKPHILSKHPSFVSMKCEKERPCHIIAFSIISKLNDWETLYWIDHVYNILYVLKRFSTTELYVNVPHVPYFRYKQEQVRFA